MPRFLPEYREVDTRSTGEKVVLTISLIILFLFIPATVFGFYAEKSIPGQILYPMKRGIESVVLSLESLSPYSKSLYYQRLAQTRVSEASSLIAEAASTGDTQQLAAQTDTTLTDAYTSIQEAAVTIKKISDPVQKQQAQQQLNTSIQNYQTQLSQMSYTLHKNVTDTNQIIPTPTVATTTSQTVSVPTPTPDPTTILQNQIDQTQNDLQNLSNTLQTTPSPTPIMPPTPTDTPTPTITTTPTPTPWWQQNQHRNHNQQYWKQGGN